MGKKALAFLAAAALVITACGGDDSDDSAESTATTRGSSSETTQGSDALEPATIDLVLQQINFMTAQIPLAQELGFLDDEGIELNITISEEGSVAAAGLASGEFDMQLGGSDVLLAWAQGADVTAVAGSNNAPVWSVLAKSDIGGMDELAGHAVAVGASDTIPALAFSQALQELGTSTDGMTLIAGGGTSGRYAALQSGQVDAALVSSPFEFQAVNEGFKNLGSLAELVPDLVSGVVMANNDWAVENHDVLIRFLRAYARTLQWMNDPANKDQFVSIMSEAVQLDPGVTEAAYDYWLTGDLAGVQFPEDGQLNVEGLHNVADAYVAAGALDAVPDNLDSFFDPQYLNEALDSM